MTPPLHELDSVVLLKDRPDAGLRAGDVGGDDDLLTIRRPLRGAP